LISYCSGCFGLRFAPASTEARLPLRIRQPLADYSLTSNEISLS
jgi:hypothetical protein